MIDIAGLTVSSIRTGLKAKKFSAKEIAADALAFAQAENPKTNAYLTFAPERTLQAAAKIDEALAAGAELPMLAGVPLGVKDVIVTRGLRTTCGSRMLEKYIPPYDATAVTRLEAAGAMVIGKLNCDEFAMGSSNENSAYGPVRNPRALDRVPGGSSGGSAAAVAQGTAVVTLGSDTGGSIRQPASFCGVVGVTPTYGRVSRYGLVAFASSLDHIGPFARNVEDAATVLKAMAGRDEMDSTSAFAPVDDYDAAMKQPVKGLKIGLPKEYFDGLNAETGDVIHAAVEQLRKLGCEVHNISLPNTKYGSIRWRALHHSRGRRNTGRYVSAHTRRGIRGGSKAAYHAWHLCAERRLLRCVLSQGAAGADADRQGFQRGFQAGGRHSCAGVAVPGFQDRRKDGRSAGDVSVRRLYAHGRSVGCSLHVRSVRAFAGRFAGGPADFRAAL
jgi:aspartyl-tRNA(Asn)/glutamyl-tRNA(Gln) amidotransferase subunit A